MFTTSSGIFNEKLQLLLFPKYLNELCQTDVSFLQSLVISIGTNRMYDFKVMHLKTSHQHFILISHMCKQGLFKYFATNLKFVPSLILSLFCYSELHNATRKKSIGTIV